MAGLNRFEDFELSRKLQEAISSARLEKPTELQKQVIPPALDGCDVIFEARSGMGKSACFGIPFLQNWLRNRNQKGMIVTATADGVRQMGKVISRLCPALKTKVLKFTAKDDFFYPDLLARSPMAILELAVVERFIKREKEFASSVKMLGIDDFEPKEACLTFEPSQRLILYTDGMTDATNPAGEHFGEQRLLDAVRTHDSSPPDAAADGVFAIVESFRAGAKAIDDETIVIIDRV